MQRACPSFLRFPLKDIINSQDNILQLYTILDQRLLAFQRIQHRHCYLLHWCDNKINLHRTFFNGFACYLFRWRPVYIQPMFKWRRLQRRCECLCMLVCTGIQRKELRVWYVLPTCVYTERPGSEKLNNYVYFQHTLM